MTCTRCGKKIAPGTTVCPACGTLLDRQGGAESTRYGEYPVDQLSGYNDSQPLPTYEQGYAAQQSFEEPLQFQQQSSPQDREFHGSPQQPPPLFQTTAINVTVVNKFAAPPLNKNNALLVEILCSLFGIYGIGWLMAGETVTGIILLACSLVIIWPLAIAIAVFTLGFGIFFCDMPLTIVGVIVNAILLNTVLNRKSVQYGFPTTYAQQMPPRHMPPRNIPQ